MANRAELLKKIQARQTEKAADRAAKWAKMRQTAADAGEFEKRLARLADLCAAASEGFTNLRENLDLIQAPKGASMPVRVAAARKYAKSFRRIAEESPEQVADAVAEAYKSLDEIAGALEMAADDLGIDLEATPVEEEFAEEGKLELEHGEAEGEGIVEEQHGEEEIEDEKEAAGSAGGWFTTDRDAEGKAKIPERADVPRVANSGPGAQGFVTDRDSDGKPATPKKVEIPQADAEAQTSIKDASARKRKRGDAAPEPAEAFVREIPQSQGKTEVGAGKRGNENKGVKQEIPPGTPAAKPAGEFVENIPQSQGKTEVGAGRAAAARK